MEVAAIGLLLGALTSAGTVSSYFVLGTQPSTPIVLGGGSVVAITASTALLLVRMFLRGEILVKRTAAADERMAQLLADCEAHARRLEQLIVEGHDREAQALEREDAYRRYIADPRGQVERRSNPPPRGSQ